MNLRFNTNIHTQLQCEEEKRVARITQGKQTIIKKGPSLHGDRKGSFRRRSIRLAQNKPGKTASTTGASADVVSTRTESTRRKHRINSEGESCKYRILCRVNNLPKLTQDNS